jgi:hypothetical protein
VEEIIGLLVAEVVEFIILLLVLGWLVVEVVVLEALMLVPETVVDVVFHSELLVDQMHKCIADLAAVEMHGLLTDTTVDLASYSLHILHKYSKTIRWLFVLSITR